LKKIEDKLPVKAENFPVLTGKFSGLQKCRVGELFFAGALMSTGEWNALNHNPYSGGSFLWVSC
jgi:hypothetical protein